MNKSLYGENRKTQKRPEKDQNIMYFGD